MRNLKVVFDYIKYYFVSTNEHGLHSPFLFHLALNVIYLKHPFYEYEKLNEIRMQLLKSNETIIFEDYGAGSNVFRGNKRRINEIAKHGITNRKHAELLFRLVNHFQPENILELGTSLGLTTMYLASASKKTKVFTIEGSKSLVEFAQKQFFENNFSNIELINGNFNDQLPVVLDKLDKIDFVFIDGNHEKNATIKYFNLLLSKSHEKTIMVFDDIHWSQGMNEAWNEIKKNEKVKISIDLFFMGIIIFRKEQREQEHFILKNNF
jgi:predicted O-methyltransferase YrrM